MPAIAPIEDLKAAQKDGLSIYAMLYVYPPKPWRRQAPCEKLVAIERRGE